MTNKIYRPDGSGGLLQLKSGSSWLPIFGVQALSASGGDRETSTFETLDGGVESTFGQAGVKDISITLNPSFMGAQWRKIIQNAYYSNDVVTIRYRTLANISDIAEGATGDGISTTKIDAGLGNEGDLTFEKDSAGSAGETAGDQLKESGELGLVVTGTDTVPGDTERTEAEPAKGKFLVARWDESAEKFKVSEWNGREVAAITTKDGWALIRYGLAVEYTCRVTSAANPDFATGSAIGDTLNLRQIASGMKIYPILKAATA